MARNHYSRFREGVQLSGVAMNVHQKGKVFYVCNSSVPAERGSVGSNSSKGLTPENPVSTIAAAVSLCVANRGDKIVVLPGHAETISAASSSTVGISLSKAGVSVIGVGEGSQRPTVTLDTANTATVEIAASDVTVQNILFVGNFLAIATCIKLKNATTAKDVKILDCEFRDTDSTRGFVKAVTTSTTDNNNDGLVVRNTNMYGTGTTAATAFVNVVGAIDRLVVEDNNVFVQGSTATTGVLVLATSKAMTTAYIKSNNAQSLYTGSAGCLIVGTSGSTGVVRDNFITITGGGTDLLCTASTGLGFANNTIQSAADKSGTLFPAIE